MSDEENVRNENEERPAARPVTIVRVVRRSEGINTPERRIVTRKVPENSGENTQNVPPLHVYKREQKGPSYYLPSGATFATEPKECKYKRIILIGMPCSGKTSIGRSVAAICGYTFYDMDAYIEEKAGMTIPEIFAQPDGEASFRKLETEAAKELGNTDKAVIATGGGAVTREETMNNLNLEDSFTVFIHRSLYKIAVTPQKIMDKRPLLENTSLDKLTDTYKKRLPLYKKYANIQVENDRNREEAVKRISEMIF